MAGGGLTPEQKWRAEAIAWLNTYDSNRHHDKLSNEQLRIRIDLHLDKIEVAANYLLMEYIINVKPQKETQQHIAEIKSQKHLS